ncbi:PAAR domain-containing protein [Yersinia wautersii]|uniref:PAAR domain-containing protein n=3 Tax=Yersinia wautersii TaxID=1341643 RepID=A0ABM9TKZ7_9GAMM|nr:PAAR domain-containing protein [Yersinia wautersii]CRG52266.1 PAAR domain-containing protein [Yersinia wautersii]
MAKGYYLGVGDKTTCGGVITEGDATHVLMGKAVAREQDRVTCGKHPGTYIIIGHVPGDSVNGRKFAGTLNSQSNCPCKAWFIPSLVHDTYEFSSMITGESNEQQTQNSGTQQDKKKPEPLIPPVLIFDTKKRMDDYAAEDMRYGDITEDVLKKKFHLTDVSARVNPYTTVNRQSSTKILFDEFRDLSDAFSFYGEYKGVIRKMITHMEKNTGKPYSDPLLDKALREQILNDKSPNSSLLKIKEILRDYIDWQEQIYPLDNENELRKNIATSVLPKFNDYSDRINGLVITVHDTWSTHITLQSLKITGDTYTATIKYRVQDHFGLDNDDISNHIYRQLRIFRIWFVLQRGEMYSYRPFITEMNTVVTIEGKR